MHLCCRDLHEMMGTGLFIQPHSVLLVTACFMEKIFFFNQEYYRFLCLHRYVSKEANFLQLVVSGRVTV